LRFKVAALVVLQCAVCASTAHEHKPASYWRGQFHVSNTERDTTDGASRAPTGSSRASHRPTCLTRLTDLVSKHTIEHQA
jgi:hypothetical protein